MSSSLTKEQKHDIRKSLPLKIFERREEAADIEHNIRYNKKLLSDLMRIEIKPGYGQHIEFSGLDFCGETVTARANLSPNAFKPFRDDLAGIVRGHIKQRECELAAIPNAKIITVDFRNKKIDPDTKPEPLFRPRYDELPEDATAIYQGALNICKALDMGFKSSDIPNLVKEKGLPAFKANGKKHWYAPHLKLMLWKQKEQKRIERES